MIHHIIITVKVGVVAGQGTAIIKVTTKRTRDKGTRFTNINIIDTNINIIDTTKSTNIIKVKSIQNITCGYICGSGKVYFDGTETVMKCIGNPCMYIYLVCFCIVAI